MVSKGNVRRLVSNVKWSPNLLTYYIYTYLRDRFYLSPGLLNKKPDVMTGLLTYDTCEMEMCYTGFMGHFQPVFQVFFAAVIIEFSNALGA